MTVNVGELIGGPGEFKQTLDLGDHIIEISDGLVRINFDNIQEEFEEAGPKVAYVGSVSARVTRMAKVARLMARHHEAQLAKSVRAAAKARGDRVTDQMVKEEVRADESALAMRIQQLDVQEAANILENLKFTLARVQQGMSQHIGMLMAERSARSEPDYIQLPARTPAKRRADR